MVLKALDLKSTAEIASLTHLSERTVRSIWARALERGFDPSAQPLIVANRFLENAPISGRPSKIEAVVEAAITKVQQDQYGREKSTAQLAAKLIEEGLNTSARTVHRALQSKGFNKIKPIRKPGLSAKMRKEQLNWCLKRQD